MDGKGQLISGSLAQEREFAELMPAKRTQNVLSRANPLPAISGMRGERGDAP
jgi:hypothetical protein